MTLGRLRIGLLRSIIAATTQLRSTDDDANDDDADDDADTDDDDDDDDDSSTITASSLKRCSGQVTYHQMAPTVTTILLHQLIAF